MKLTRFTDLGLRILMYLAVYRNESKLATVQDIANRVGWSHHHIVKVVNWLARSGYIASMRGRTGGLRLKRDPVEYRIGSLIRAMESDTELIICESPKCRLMPACRLGGIIKQAQEQFFEALDNYTLADVMLEDEMRFILDEWRDSDEPAPRLTTEGQSFVVPIMPNLR